MFLGISKHVKLSKEKKKLAHYIHGRYRWHL